MLNAIYMQVLDMSRTACVVIPAVLLARLMLKKAPKAFSYALWAVVLFRLLCPVSPEAPVSIVPELPPVSQSYPLAGEPISLPGAGEAAYRAIGDALNGGLGVQHIRTTERDEAGMTKYVTTDWWSVWLLFGRYVWILGVAAMLLYSAVSYRRLRRKLAVVVPLRDNICLADDIRSPFVIGLLHPKIYLPCDLEEREQEYIILHEQYHIRRLDHIFKALAFLALALHWFNPLVWLAFVLAGKDMEMSCDEAVVRRLGGDVRADYSASLLTLATGRRIIAGTPLAFGEGDTGSRIKNLAGWRKPALRVILVSVSVCAVLAVCLLTDPVEPPASDDTDDSWYLVIGTEGVQSIEISTPDSSGGVVHADSSAFQRGERVWLEPLDGIWDLRGLSVTAYDSDENILYQLSVPEYVSDEEVINIVAGDGWLLAPDSAIPDAVQRQCTDILPGTTYVPYQCIYMNPLSSYAAMGGDSGCKYIIGENSFAIVNRNDGSIISAGSNPSLSESTPVSYEADVEKWEWQEFPYTDGEWGALYWPQGFGTQNISEIYDEILYQPLEKNRFLLRVDGALWLVELRSNDRMGTYLWSIYSLVPESVMGTARWEYAPMFSSRSPVFRFVFDMDYTEISAVCTQSPLVDFDSPGTPSDTGTILREGKALYWSPVNRNGQTASSAVIHFSLHEEDRSLYSGTIYIEGERGADGRMLYTASIVGTGLHLKQNMEQEGGVISAVAPPLTVGG